MTTTQFLWTGIRSIGFVHSQLMKVECNSTSESLIHITDWMPTFLHMATGRYVNGESLGIDGVDQFDVITKGRLRRQREVRNKPVI